eukprot:TRINITY_DN2747_c0_g1_i1.p1 TRINITY_DN2747_c0_g1~~TRINITY_DN2747_c0_g1_i1.p1  ORF type:complete len:612 (-),score=183.13 TRINITY_DN2747_c0_g1_i1:684-2519(-)
MADMELIVDRLNEPPFNMELSLVTFDDKTGDELLEILNKVLCHISPNHARDLSEESPEETMYRMMDCLRLLNYKKPADVDPNSYAQGIASGDRNIIYPILVYLLSKTNALIQRAYIARFLAPIEIPEELIHDEAISEAVTVLKSKQEEFKVAHKQAMAVRGDSVQPEEGKKRLTAIEEERETLFTKINRLKEKMQAVSRHEEMFDLVKKLRKEQEDQIRLEAKIREQESLVQQLTVKTQLTQQKLKDMKSDRQDASPEALLKRLEEELKRNKILLAEDLPKQLADQYEASKRMEEILATPPMSEAEIDKLQGQINSQMKEITQMIQKRDQMTNPADDKLAIFRQQVMMVSRKKEESLDRLNRLKTEKAQVESEYAEKDRQAAGMKGKMLKQEDFKKYVSTLKSKKVTYRRMKEELSELRTEVAVLTRTEEVIKGRATNLQEIMQELEKRRGVSGFQSTQNQLEAVSEMKSQIDEDKGRTLEEISRVVAEITATIKDRKNRLAPQVKELRSQREKFQEVERDYLKKKAEYEAEASKLEAETSKLSSDLGSMNEECAREESKYHYLNCMVSIIDVNANRGTSSFALNRVSCILFVITVPTCFFFPLWTLDESH